MCCLIKKYFPTGRIYRLSLLIKKHNTRAIPAKNINVWVSLMQNLVGITGPPLTGPPLLKFLNLFSPSRRCLILHLPILGGIKKQIWMVFTSDKDQMSLILFLWGGVVVINDGILSDILGKVQRLCHVTLCESYSVLNTNLKFVHIYVTYLFCGIYFQHL